DRVVRDPNVTMDGGPDQPQPDAHGGSGRLDAVGGDVEVVAAARDVDACSRHVELVPDDADAGGGDVRTTYQGDAGPLGGRHADAVVRDGQVVEAVQCHPVVVSGRHHVAGDGHLAAVHAAHPTTVEDVPTEADASRRRAGAGPGERDRLGCGGMEQAVGLDHEVLGGPVAGWLEVEAAARAG